MDAIQTHPSTAAQAKAFTAPNSFSMTGGVGGLGGAGGLTPPFDADKVNGRPQQVANGTGVTPATPAATPAAVQGGSGLTPTLQYVSLVT